MTKKRNLLKSIFSIVLAIVMLFTVVPFTEGIEVKASKNFTAKYGSDYRRWNQGASAYSEMREVGCLITAQAKMLYEANINRGINPDSWYEWLWNNGYLANPPWNLTMKNPYGPVNYAKSIGKQINYLGYWTANDSQLWFNIRAGYYSIINVGGHWVMLDNKTSQSTGKLYYYESYSSDYGKDPVYNQFTGNSSPYPLSRYGNRVGAHVYQISNPSPTPPPTPTNIKINKNDIGMGEGIAVSWNSSFGATGYNVDLICTTNSANNQSKSVGGTSTSFSITKAGTYKISISAKNSAGTSSSSSSSSFIAHKNVTVKYEDWDGSILKTQDVKWNGDAIAPSAPSREGYTFQNWSSDGKGVKGDIIIKAQYKINTYSVSFVDYKGEVIGHVQKIEYGSSATPPVDVPTKEGYVFSEWSTKEYKEVKKSLTIKAVYVWENVNLPIVTKIISAKRNDEATGYDIEVKLSNFPNDFTKGKLVASLKTKKGKMVASEVKSISMPTEGEVTEKFTILYSGLAPRVDVSMIGVVDDDTTGTPKAKIVTSPIDIGNKWSDWSTTVPTGNDIITDSRTEYRYKDTKIIKAITQPATPTGYSLISKESTGTYTTWGNWSSWSDSAISGNTLRNVQTQSVVASYKTQYNYSRWTSNSNNTGNLGPVRGTWGGVYCGYYFERGWTDSALAVSGNQYSNQVGGNFNLYGNNQWFNQNTRSVAASYKTQYRYQTRNEYSNYKYKQNEFNEWQAEKIDESDTREVQTRTAYRFKTNSTEVPCYNYKRYKYVNINNGKTVYSYTSSYADSMDYPGEWEYKTEFKELEKISTVDDGIELYNGTGENSWYKADVNAEGNSKIFETTSSLEDQTGVARTLEGKVDGAVGKVATLMIYKGKNEDPIASQIEYIGQTIIGDDGSYKFDYVTKEEPSLTTGDFVISLGIEGATNYVNIGKIEAPKKVYSVDFIDETGKAIGERKSVVEGGTVVAPEAPVKEGYDFIGWDTGLRNIQENTVITAQYKKKTYSVIFIDWDATSVGIREFEYGDILEAPESDLVKEGQIFDKWIDEDNNKVSNVTRNMIVTAQYKDAKYTVRFMDWNGELISERKVNYGEKVEAIDNLENDNDDTVFDGWTNSDKLSFVRENIVLTPLLKYKETSDKPVVSVMEGIKDDEKRVGIYSYNSDENIYYMVKALDEEGENEYVDYDEFSLYKSPITIKEGNIVYAYAVSSNTNKSKLVSQIIDNLEEETSQETSTIPTTTEMTTEIITDAPTTGEVTTTEKVETTKTIETTKQETTTEKMPTKPTGLQGIVDKNDNYNIFWNQSENTLYYNIYVNNTLVGNTISANYCIPASQFKENGNYTVGVEAVNSVGVSDIVTIIYKVIGEVTTEEKSSEVITTEQQTTISQTTGDLMTTQVIEDKTDESSTSQDETTVSAQVDTSKKLEKDIIISTKVNNSKVNVASTRIKKIKANKKSLKIAWKKVRGVNGYQIQYSTSNKFKKARKITIKKMKVTSKTIKRLKAEKKYYVRIRTYIVVRGKIYYSKWVVKGKKTK